MILSWIFIAIVAFVIFLALFKSQDLMAILGFIKKYMFTVIIIGFILFLSFVFYRVYSTHDINLGSYNGIIETGKLYLLWFKSAFDNLGRITGYAVNQDWVLNSTNTTR